MSDHRVKITRGYNSFTRYDNKLVPNQGSDSSEPTLAAGMYTLHKNQDGVLWFQEMQNTHDEILDLPSPEYNLVVNQIRTFLKPETKVKYQELGYLYKRSALLHGQPGTGKTCIVNRVMQDVVKMGGVVLFAQSPYHVEQAFSVLNSTQPDVLTLVVFEEFDGTIELYGETAFLNLLDGEMQKNNVVYLMTTNFVDKISKRIMRPGRISSVVEVGYPIEEARRLYLKTKLGAEVDVETFVKVSKGLSIDDLKEIVQSVCILGEDLKTTVKRLQETRGLEVVEPEDDEEDDEEEEGEENKIEVGEGDSVTKLFAAVYGNMGDEFNEFVKATKS